MFPPLSAKSSSISPPYFPPSGAYGFLGAAVSSATVYKIASVTGSVTYGVVSDIVVGAVVYTGPAVVIGSSVVSAYLAAAAATFSELYCLNFEQKI